LIATALAALLTLALWIWVKPGENNPYALEVVVEAYAPGFAQIYFDRGYNLRESDSTKQPLGVGENRVRLPFPAGTIKSIRFDPIDRNGTAKFGVLRLISPTGRVVRTIKPDEFSPNDQVAETRLDQGQLTFTSTASANDPQFSLQLKPPLELSFSWWQGVWMDHGWLLRRFLVAFVSFILVERVWRHRRSCIGIVVTLRRNHPRAALALCAALAAVLSSYPVVFFGRSFVSPSTTMLLYNSTPSVPGYSDRHAEDARGADVGAMLWQHYPYTVQQNRALRAGEWPWWNRFAACGITLIGQGQTMLGDPLQFLVVLTNGASWAFDLKYVLCKALFACGLAWCVWALTRDFIAAAILALGGAFIAFFNYRLNHPSIFTLSYSPWILFAWMQLRDAAGPRSFRHALLLWYVANWMVMTSGTVKEAYLLAASLNLTGALIYFTQRPRLIAVVQRGALLGVAGVAFLLATMPLWRTFLDALKVSYTNYDIPSLVQLPGQWFVGLFDDVFYREFMPWHNVHKPAANFLILLGCLWAVVQPRRLLAAREPLIILAIAAGSLLLAFRFGSATWISSWALSVPLLRNVVNLDTIFSCIALVHLCVLAGWGFSAARRPLVESNLRRFGWIMGVVVSALFAAYFLIQPTNFAAAHTWPKLEQLKIENWILYSSVVLLPLAAWTLTMIAVRRLRAGRIGVAGTALALLALTVLLARHGQHLSVFSTTYFAAPGPRENLQASSPTVDFLRNRTAKEPGRVIGLDRNMFAGFSSIYGLEFVYGANALENRSYRQLAEAGGLVTPSQWIFDTPIATMSEWRPLANFLNVRFLVAPIKLTVPNAGFHEVLSADLKVFENEHPWPRAFFVGHLDQYATPGDLIRLIRERENASPFAAIQTGDDVPDALETAVAQLTQTQTTSAIPAHSYSLRTNSTAFTIDAPSAGVAALHETWLPDDFVATVNGAVVPYLRVNHAFKGVLLPAAGSYRIEFSYRPKNMTASLAMSGFGLLLALGTWFAPRWLKFDSGQGHRGEISSKGSGEAQLDEEFYRSKSWGSLPIRPARDLPSLKMRYLSELLARRPRPDARLLEVGCGSGRILASIHQREAALKLTGIDLSAEQIELARRSHPTIEFVCGNGEALPFPDASFDYVVFFDYLEHVERPRQSLAEIQRVLKPGGQLHLVCPAERQSIYGWSSTIFGRHFKNETAGHIQQFSRRELEQLVEASGFRVSDRHYSYHLLGSLMDYTLFTLMLHPRVSAAYWSSNPYYATGATPPRSGLFQRVLRLGNLVAYYESRWLGRFPWTATAVHFTATKPK
jgi:ubiquinone/menaquinone biosynthesis C-methylase UbiE